MALNPLHVLKRKLEDESSPLNKRLCLAKNVVKTHHFPTGPKEKIVAEWLESVVIENKVRNEEFMKILSWAVAAEELTMEMKSKLILITATFLQTNTVQNDNIPTILSFIENDKISKQLHNHVAEFIFIATTILKHLKDDIKTNVTFIQRILNGLLKLYKETKKKLEFIVKLLEGDNIETIFDYLDNPDIRSTVLNVCQSILFPSTKKSFFALFLKTLLQKDNIDQLMEEKGDNMQSVLKVMTVFFTFPSGRTCKDHNFIRRFIEVFVTSFKNESQLIFAFHIMVGSSLGFDQSYMSSTMKMPPIGFGENDEKIKRSLFLSVLQILIDNEIDVNVRLTNTLGESKVEIKKTFSIYLQTVMLGLLKLEGKTDKITLQIVHAALKLDPTLVEKKLEQILPLLMVQKKGIPQMESYIEMLNCLLEILFKLSRGTLFLNQVLPHLKIALEAGNTEQFELQQKINSTEDDKKVKNKILTGNDVFPKESTELYGKLTSELMFRQNSELLVSLHKDLEENCLMMLEEGFVSPSIITLSEVISGILSSFLRRTKMADQAVPQQISEDFWTAFGLLENDGLKRFGECVLKLNYNQRLTQAFLQLSSSIAELKLLNIQYSNIKLDITLNDTSEVLDLSVLLPCLNSDQWIALGEKVDPDSVELLNNLLLLKLIATQILSPGNTENLASETKAHLIKEISGNPEFLTGNTMSQIIFANLDAAQTKQLSKVLVKQVISGYSDILENDAITNNRSLLNSLTMEVLKNTVKIIDSEGKLAKAIAKSNFDLAEFHNVNSDYFTSLSNRDKSQDDEVSQYVEILKKLKIYYLEEKTQLATIFVLLALKKSDAKKLRKSCDVILQSTFELSSKTPDLFKIFTIENLFDFENKVLLDLLTLKIKTSNPHLLLKAVLETAVKKVKSNPEIIKIIVKIVLTNQKVKKEEISNMDYFNDEVFQITCLILPLIAKEKRALTSSQFRSILAELQEKLHKSLLKSFKSINFANEMGKMVQTGSTDGENDKNMATLNAMDAFSLTLSKYCETTDVEEIKNLDCLWNGLGYFVNTAIKSLENVETKQHHVNSSIQLLNVVLRHIKKLESHPTLSERNKILVDIWSSIKNRTLIIFQGGNDSCLDEIGVTIKFVCELVSEGSFGQNIVADLNGLMMPKKQHKSDKKEQVVKQQTYISHQVGRQLITACLKSNIIGPKCLSISRIIYRTIKNLCQMIRQIQDGNENDKVIQIDEETCDILKIDLDLVSEVIWKQKKIPIDYKFMDALFELQQLMHIILGRNTIHIKCEIAWESYFKLFSSCVAVLYSLVGAREELLEDRWPSYLQCYRSLVSSLCEKSTSQNELEKSVEDRLAELSHSIEKLTQAISKKKAHISRLASYTVGDLCSLVEKNAPNRLVRQHLENSVAFLIQASDTSYSMAFLRRALAGAPGQMTMTNLYTMYKRYHKYVGNS